MSIPPSSWPPSPGTPSPYGTPASGGGIATLILVLGILSLFGVLGFLGPFAWIMGNNALASGTLSPEEAGKVSSGRICGIIGTGLLVIGILGTIALVGIFFIAGLSSSH